MRKSHFKIRFLITILIPLIASSNVFAVFLYDPVTDPIVSATFTIDVAAFTAHRYVFGEQVNYVSLFDMTGGLGRYDLSDALFGTSSYPDVPLVNMSPLETGWISAEIDSYFFPALTSGKVGLSFCLTDTGDSMFAMDFMSLTIRTTSSVIESYFGWPVGNENNGFGIGLADGADLPAPLPISIPVGATGTGFDETIATKVVPEPASLLFIASGAAILFLKRRRSSNKKEKRGKIHNKSFLLSLLIVISLTTYHTASTVQANQVGNFVPSTITLSNVRYHDDAFASSGNFAFELENAPGTGVSYLNVALDRNNDGIVDPCEWVIQNVPFANSDFSGYSHSVYFHLDTEKLSADAYVILNDSKVAPPTGSYNSLGWSYFMDVPFEIEHLAEPIPDGNAPPAGPPATSGDRLPSGRSNVPDIPQYKNECGPTSTANSIIWLAERDGWVKKLLKAAGRPEANEVSRSDSNKPREHTEDEDSIIKGLMEAMRREVLLILIFQVLVPFS